MADATTNSRRERSSAKGLFTKACNRLSEAITIESEFDLIESKFETLKIRWNDVQVKNDAYLAVVYPDGNEDVAEVQWLDDLEEKFEVAEKAKFDYVRNKKKLYEREIQESKHEVELKFNKHESDVESKGRKAARNMHHQILLQEIKLLKELMKEDKDCRVKTPIEEALKDVKLHLEKCRESHMHFLQLLSGGQDDREHQLWIEDLYTIRSDVNTTVTQHFLKAEQTKDSMFKIEKVKLPFR